VFFSVYIFFYLCYYTKLLEIKNEKNKQVINIFIANHLYRKIGIDFK